MIFSAAQGMICGIAESIPEKETPVAKIENDNYVPYNYENRNNDGDIINSLNSEIESMGGYVEKYSSEEEYQRAQKSASSSAADYSLVESQIESVKQTFTVMTTPTGSKEHGNYVASKPVANAIVRLDGVPRYTDRNGQIKVTLNREYVELYVEKEGYNPYIEIIEPTGEEKVINLKKPSDDIYFEYVMIDYNGYNANVLVQDIHYTLFEEYSYVDLFLKTNITADEYRIYCDDKLVCTQDNGNFYLVEFDEFSKADSHLTVQATYQGIDSEITDLNIYIREPIEQKDICDPEDITVDFDFDSDDEVLKSRNSGEKPGFFGNLKFDIQDLLKDLFPVLDKTSSTMALNFSIDPHTGNISAIIGYELELENTGIDRLQKKHDKIVEEGGKTPENKAERDKILKEINDIKTRDYKIFGNTYNQIKKSLQSIKDEGVSLKNKRKVFDQIKKIKKIKPSAKNKKIVHYSNAPKLKFDFQVVGTFEFSVQTKQFVDIELVVDINASVEFGGQFVVVYVPCFWRAEFGIEVELKFTFLTEEDRKALFKLEDFFKLSVEIYGKGEIGVGFCDLLSVSGYLRLGLRFEWQVAKNYVDLYGTVLAGVKLKALFWDFQWDIYDNKWKLASNHENKQKIRCLNNSQNNIYEASKPVLTMFRDKQILTWVEYSYDRNVYNNTVLMYSVYDNNNWTMPKPVYDNGYADFDYDIYNDNDENLYITWQGASREYDFNDDLLSMSQSTEIFAARYNFDLQAFENVFRLTSDDELDCQPKFVKKEKSTDPLSIVWRKNSEDNILGFTGTNYFNIKSLNGGFWSAAETVKSFNVPVSNGNSIYDNGILKTAFIVDGDGDIMTDDQDIILVYNNNTYNITNCPSTYSSVDFIKGQEGFFLLYKDKETMKIYEEDNGIIDFCPSKFTCLDDVKFVEDKCSGNILLYYTQLKEDNKQLYCSLYNNEKNIWSDNICLTDELLNVLEPSIVFGDDGILNISYYLADDDAQNISIQYIQKRLGYDVSIEEAYINQIIKTNEDFEIHIDIFNCGELPIFEVCVEVDGECYIVELETPLHGGERQYISVVHNRKGDVKHDEFLSIHVSVLENDKFVADDYFELGIYYVDYKLIVDKKIYSGKQYLNIIANSLSIESGLANLVIYRNDEIINQQRVDMSIGIEINYQFEEIAVDDFIKIELIADNSDFDLSNNTIYLYSTKNEIKTNKYSNIYMDTLNYAKKV